MTGRGNTENEPGTKCTGCYDCCFGDDGADGDDRAYDSDDNHNHHDSEDEILTACYGLVLRRRGVVQLKLQEACI